MIILSGGWAIDSDNTQYILGKPVTTMVKDKPSRQMQNATYHATLEQAFTKHLRRIQREIVKTHDLTAEEAFRAFSAAHSEVTAMFGNMEEIP